MSSWMIDPATAALTGALDGLSRREQAIAANIVNIDTPGYKQVASEFESELALQLTGAATPPLTMNPPTTPPPASSAMLQADPAHLAGGAGESTVPAMFGISTQPEMFQQRVDGNGVDIDTQMTALSETQLKYAATSRMLTQKLGQLKDVLAAR
jgi:flagellar basal-body rod protein FlgB